MFNFNDSCLIDLSFKIGKYCLTYEEEKEFKYL
jgi:hypothetical protein